MKSLQSLIITTSFSKKQRILLLLFFCMLFVSEPYVFSLLLGLDIKLLWMVFAVIFVLLTYNGRSVLPKPFIISIFVQILVWGFYYFLHHDQSYITRIIFIIVSYFLLSGLETNIGLNNFVHTNNKLLSIQSFLGAIAFILVFVGVLHPFFSFIQQDTRTAYFLGLTCTNVIEANIIRISGFFDEPGALAQWGMYALVLNRLFIKNKHIEYILVGTLIFTLSLAYYIQLILYFILFYSKNYRRVFPIAIIVIFFLLFISYDVNSYLYEKTIGRLELFAQVGLGATTRGDLTDIAKQYFLENPIWGLGASNVLNKNVYLADNPFETLATDGIVGTFAIYFPLLVVVSRKFNRYIISGVIVLAAGYMQRPFHINIMHFLMMYTFCILALRYSSITQKK